MLVVMRRLCLVRYVLSGGGGFTEVMGSCTMGGPSVVRYLPVSFGCVR